MILQAKKTSCLIYIISLILLAISCADKNKNSKQLSVTIEPQRYFLEQLVGERYDVTCLIPAGSNPESFDATPSQMMTLDRSIVYFKIGFLGIENTLIEKVKDQSLLNIVDCSNGIDILKDNHIHLDNDEHDQYHGHSGGDPHYWSSINSAKTILSNMLNTLIKIDEINKEFYTNNYKNEIAKINETDSIIRYYLSNSDSKAFVIYHPALSYLAKEYDLEQLSIEHEGKNPSPTQLKKLIDTAKEKKIKAVFIQQEFDVKNAEVIAKQIEAKTYPINLLSYNWHDEMIRIAKAIGGNYE